MKFGTISVAEAEGAILAHALTVRDTRFPKAHRLTAEDVAVLTAASVETVTAASLEPGDLDENAAAAGLAAAFPVANVAARPAATGRVNLHATCSGVFIVDAGVVAALNSIDPSITLATLADNATVTRGQMVATVKIIPFAVPGPLVARAIATLGKTPLLDVRGFSAARVTLVQTTLPGVKATVLDKTRRVTQRRLDRSASRIVDEVRPGHAVLPLTEALRSASQHGDMTVVFGASALCDFDDVIPAAIRAAGGAVTRAGMPVDPGNLLVLGRIGGHTVIGAPGCARSPKENGFDWVLDRLMAGMEVTDQDIAGMGVGGLLMEIGSRPQPREAPPFDTAEVHAVVLAAGRSSRMGGPNKLMARFDGVALVRRVVAQALASAAKSVTVVTGHQQARIADALHGLNVTLVHNSDYAAGLAGSLRTGIDALPDTAAGALIVLGDMPGIGAGDLDTMIAAFAGAGGLRPVRASHGGKRGNPVILLRSLFPELARVDGDTGARHLIEREGMDVIDIDIGPAASLDVDTAEAMAAAGGVLQD